MIRGMVTPNILKVSVPGHLVGGHRHTHTRTRIPTHSFRGKKFSLRSMYVVCTP